MKPKKILFFILCVLFIFGVFIYTRLKSEGFPVLKGPYLGQKPPGLKPILFAPDIISTLGHEGSSGFALKREGLYFSEIH